MLDINLWGYGINILLLVFNVCFFCHYAGKMLLNLFFFYILFNKSHVSIILIFLTFLQIPRIYLNIFSDKK